MARDKVPQNLNGTFNNVPATNPLDAGCMARRTLAYEQASARSTLSLPKEIPWIHWSDIESSEDPRPEAQSTQIASQFPTDDQLYLVFQALGNFEL